VFDKVHTGFLAGDDYEQAARLRADDAVAGEAESAQVVALVTDAPPEVLGRVVLAVAALHEPGTLGHCPQCAECQPCRWRRWRRTTHAPDYPCPTWRVMAIELPARHIRPAIHPGMMVVPLGVVLPAMVGALIAGVVAGALLMDAATRPPRSMRPTPRVGRRRSTR
jgi:hypothetical protein